MAIRIGIIGLGKIAREQHIPALRANAAFSIVAGADPLAPHDLGFPIFADHLAMLGGVALDAVAICTPPAQRHAIALACLDAGLHVLLEKPPCATLGEARHLVERATAARLSLFTAWHAQANAAVEQAAVITRREGIAALRIEWVEDVEKWHAGQQWIWAPGGMGVFDAGVNALSILTRLSAQPVLVVEARLVLHEAAQQPIAADVLLRSAAAPNPWPATFDWRHKGAERWTIELTTSAGTQMLIEQGGAVLVVQGQRRGGEAAEYPLIYRDFARLITAGQCQADLEPLRLISDILLVASRRSG